MGAGLLGVPGPPNLGLPLPWKPETEGNLEITWPLSPVLQPCHWRPERGLATTDEDNWLLSALPELHTPSLLGFGSMEISRHLLRPKPVLGDQMSGGAGWSCVCFAARFKLDPAKHRSCHLGVLR